MKPKISAHRSFFHRLGFTLITMLVSVQLLLPSPVVLAQTLAGLPPVGAMISPTPAFQPVLLRGMTIHPEDPFQFDFIVDPGEAGLKGNALKGKVRKLIKYFLASLTVPEKEMWVNLSPYEKNRIIPKTFRQTEMGRDLLAQDYILKQLSASLMYPEKALGKQFWRRVRERVKREYGRADIPLNTFNKIWIVPEKAKIYVHGNTVFVVDSHLKVMLEKDYLALDHHSGETGAAPGVTAEVERKVLIPEIEREVNTGKLFANLRQIYQAMILATWYKQNLKQSLLSRVYVDQGKTKGVATDDPQAYQKIYDQYLKAFKVGVYDYIKEEYDPQTREMIPRKYFSGGVALDRAQVTSVDSAINIPQKGLLRFSTHLEDVGMTEDSAMRSTSLLKIEPVEEEQGVPRVHRIWVVPTKKNNYQKELEIDGVRMPVYFTLIQPHVFEFDEKDQLKAIYYRGRTDRPLPWKWIHDNDGRVVGLLVGTIGRGVTFGAFNEHFGFGDSKMKITGWIKTSLEKREGDDSFSYIAAGMKRGPERRRPHYIAVGPARFIGEEADVLYRQGWPIVVRLPNGQTKALIAMRDKNGQVQQSVHMFQADNWKSSFMIENIHLQGRKYTLSSSKGKRYELPLGQGYAALIVDQGVILHLDEFISPRFNTYTDPVVVDDNIVATRLREPLEKKDNGSYILEPVPYGVFHDLRTYRPITSTSAPGFRIKDFHGRSGIMTNLQLDQRGYIKVGNKRFSFGRRNKNAPCEIIWLADQNVFLVDILADESGTVIAYAYDPETSNSTKITDTKRLEEIKTRLGYFNLGWYWDTKVKKKRVLLYKELMKTEGARVFSSRLKDLQEIKKHWLPQKDQSKELFERSDELGLNSAAIAELLGLAQSTIVRWRSGRSSISDDYRPYFIRWFRALDLLQPRITAYRKTHPPRKSARDKVPGAFKEIIAQVRRLLDSQSGAKDPPASFTRTPYILEQLASFFKDPAAKPFGLAIQEGGMHLKIQARNLAEEGATAPFIAVRVSDLKGKVYGALVFYPVDGQFFLQESEKLAAYPKTQLPAVYNEMKTMLEAQKPEYHQRPRQKVTTLEALFKFSAPYYYEQYLQQEKPLQAFGRTIEKVRQVAGLKDIKPDTIKVVLEQNGFNVSYLSYDYQVYRNWQKGGIDVVAEYDRMSLQEGRLPRDILTDLTARIFARKVPIGERLMDKKHIRGYVRGILVGFNRLDALKGAEILHSDLQNEEGELGQHWEGVAETEPWLPEQSALFDIDQLREHLSPLELEIALSFGHDNSSDATLMEKYKISEEDLQEAKENIAVAIEDISRANYLEGLARIVKEERDSAMTGELSTEILKESLRKIKQGELSLERLQELENLTQKYSHTLQQVDPLITTHLTKEKTHVELMVLSLFEQIILDSIQEQEIAAHTKLKREAKLIFSGLLAEDRKMLHWLFQDIYPEARKELRLVRDMLIYQGDALQERFEKQGRGTKAQRVKAKKIRKKIAQDLNRLQTLVGDAAMKGSGDIKAPAPEKNGGIDLDPAHLDIQTEGNAIPMNVPAQAPDFNPATVEGLVPVILNVRPITNMPLLLGLNEGGRTGPRMGPPIQPNPGF